MILMLVLLTIVIGMVAMSVDAGLMVLLRAEIQNAVDAGAVAAALRLQGDSANIDEAEGMARDYVRRNRVGFTAIVPEDAIDVEQGYFDGETSTFTPTSVSPNAVRVYARQDTQPFFFAKIFGYDTFGAPAEAIASADPRPLDVMMVLDLSGSMAREGRIEALQNAAPVFVDVIEELGGEDHIGVMGLSANPNQYDPADLGHSGTMYDSGLHPTADYNVGVLESELVDNFSQLKNSVLNASQLEAGKYTNYTGTGAATGDAVHYLINNSDARGNSVKAIVLMSDGAANRPSGNGPGYARQMAQYAADNEVKIYTISLGNDADLGLMQDIADITGGQHFDATGSGVAALTERLTEAFRQAAAAIKRAAIVK
jgi:Flp pilus assembly protein TadG